jgi:hypothetical protein
MISNYCCKCSPDGRPPRRAPFLFRPALFSVQAGPLLQAQFRQRV